MEVSKRRVHTGKFLVEIVISKSLSETSSDGLEFIVERYRIKEYFCSANLKMNELSTIKFQYSAISDRVLEF